MPSPIVNEAVERYMRGLLDTHDEPVLLEMEQLAEERGFPIVNRHVGVTLEILARGIGAQRVFELGSGYGYSAYWFSRASEEVHCTDGDPENEKLAAGFLSRIGLWERIRFHVGDAVTGLRSVEGEFDIIYNDIDKDGYPDAWLAARERIRPGGLYICDNVLWSARVVEDPPQDDVRPGWTEAIREHNALVAGDRRYLSSILPIRDGVMLAIRVE